MFPHRCSANWSDLRISSRTVLPLPRVAPAVGWYSINGSSGELDEDEEIRVLADSRLVVDSERSNEWRAERPGRNRFKNLKNELREGKRGVSEADDDKLEDDSDDSTSACFCLRRAAHFNDSALCTFRPPEVLKNFKQFGHCCPRIR